MSDKIRCSLEGQFGWRENSTGLLQKGGKICVFAAEMPDDQFPDPSFLCNRGSLGSSGMKPQGGPFFVFVQVSGFMIHEVGAFNSVCDIFIITGIGTIGIASWKGSCLANQFIGNDTAVGAGIIFAFFEFGIKMRRNLEFFSPIQVHFAQFFFFPEQESPAFDPVLHVETVNCQFFSFQDQSVFIQRMEEKWVGKFCLLYTSDAADE